MKRSKNWAPSCIMACILSKWLSSARCLLGFDVLVLNKVEVSGIWFSEVITLDFEKSNALACGSLQWNAAVKNCPLNSILPDVHWLTPGKKEASIYMCDLFTSNNLSRMKHQPLIVNFQRLFLCFDNFIRCDATLTQWFQRVQPGRFQAQLDETIPPMNPLLMSIKNINGNL